jgi:hypothetical protein
VRHARTLIRRMNHVNIGLGTVPRLRISREEFDRWIARSNTTPAGGSREKWKSRVRIAPPGPQPTGPRSKLTQPRIKRSADRTGTDAATVTNGFDRIAALLLSAGTRGSGDP